MSKWKITQEAVANYRPFPIALAQAIANTKVTDYPRMALLIRNYTGLNAAGKLICATELEQCKLAKRGQLEARVA